MNCETVNSLKSTAMTIFFPFRIFGYENKKYINNKKIPLRKSMKIGYNKKKTHLMNRITEYKIHNLFNANLLLRGNKDPKPMLTTTRSRVFCISFICLLN